MTDKRSDKVASVSVLFSRGSDAVAAAADATVSSVLVAAEKGCVLVLPAFVKDRLGLLDAFIAPVVDGVMESVATHADSLSLTACVFSNKLSRNLGVVRGDLISEIVAKTVSAPKAAGDALVVIHLSNASQVLSAALAVARACPIYSKKQKPQSDRTIFVGFEIANPHDSLTEAAIERIQYAADCVREAAMLVDMPPNELNPTTYVDFVRKIWADKLQLHGVTLTVIEGRELEDKGYGGMWNVGKGSHTPPALVILSHTPPKATKAVVWVGKGITFDTGGLSLKISGSMQSMKTDMGGSAGVFDAFVATVLTQTNKSFALHAILCLAENAVSDRSYRVDDIITGYSGKTVEISNTDAEGRLCLMDGVAHACKHLNPDVVIDMATLTGAQAQATGLRHAGIMSNSAELEEIVLTAGKFSGDLAFPLLYAPEFLGVDQVMSSVVADMTNIPSNSKDMTNASSASSGLFVASHMSPEKKWEEGGEGMWCHIDMAFPSKSAGRGTGYGVGLLYCTAEALESKFSTTREVLEEN
ncbi:putative aminopeptidase npepl1 [Entophlyctis luteolus]|nr:putative aminopeptidase npepl1 [Entophlyctis luteolus]